MVAVGNTAGDDGQTSWSRVASPQAVPVSEFIIDLRSDGVTIDLRDGRASIDLTEPKPSYEDLDPERLHSLVDACVGVDRRLGPTRVFDVVVGTMLLIAAIPVIVVAAVMVRISSSGSVFYASARRGHRDDTFGAWKLRTMVDEFEQRQILDDHPDLAEKLERDCKLLDDPRVTPIGRILRRTSLDELPQLWNVVRGDMSLVGPRPKTLEEAPRYGAALEPILSIRPGLTGLWQTSGRNDLPFEDRIVLDLQYVASRSLLGDVRLCLTTIRQFLSSRRHGAY